MFVHGSFRQYGARSARSLFFAIACLTAAPALAASNGTAGMLGAAPAMSGVGEMMLQTPHLGGSSATANTSACAVGRGEIETSLYKILKNYGLPVVQAMKAMPQRLDVARVNVLPEIVTAASQDTSECSAWVSLTIQTDSTVTVPPIATPRNIIVTYWRGGLLVSGNATANSRAVIDALDKLARQLVQQYKLDQPPKLNDGE